MTKKGQVSIFILLGILLLLVVGFFVLYIQEIEEIPETTLEVAVSPLQTYIEQCIETVGKDALTLVSLQGGYYNTSAPLFSLGLYEIPYYEAAQQDSVVSLETVESEIERYIDEKLPLCTGNFSVFQEQGYEMTVQELSTTVALEKDAAFFTVSYPVTAELGDSILHVAEFSVEIPTPLYQARELAEKIVMVHMNNTILPLGFIEYLAEETQLSVDMGHFNGTVIYSLNIFTENEELYVYNFAVFYDWEGEEE